MLSDFLLYQSVKEPNQLGPALFWMSPSESKKLAAMWKEVLYQLGLWGHGRLCTGDCLWPPFVDYFPHPLCLLWRTLRSSVSTCSPPMWPFLWGSLEDLPPGGEGPHGCWRLGRGPGYGHLGQVARHKSDKNGDPISLTYIAKPCADKYQHFDTYQDMAWRDKAWFVYKLNTNQRFITFLMRFSLILLSFFSFPQNIASSAWPWPSAIIKLFVRA